MINYKFERTDLVINDVAYTEMMPDEKYWNTRLFNWFYYSDKDFKLLYEMTSKNNYLGQRVICSFDGRDDDIPTGILIYLETETFISVSVLEVNPRYRNRNIGKLMMNELRSKNKLIRLQSLPESVGFYEKLGFINDSASEDDCKTMVWYTSKEDVKQAC